MSAKGSATLTFHTQKSDLSSISNGTVKVSVGSKSPGTASVPGRALVPLKGTLSERVKTRQRASDTSPYQEQTCTNARKVKGRGGLRFRRVGSKIEAEWAFPQAKPKFCRGPSPPKSITSKMRQLYPVARFTGRSATVIVSGVRKSGTGANRLTYRWRATLRLAPL